MTASARSGPAPGLLAVDVGATLNLVGLVLLYLSATFAFPTLIAVGYGESPWPFLGAAAITVVAGLGLGLATEGRERVGIREGFLVVALVWALAPAFGAVPYLLSGEEQLGSVTDAYFEAMSGFSTTSSSVLTDVEELSRSLAMWRQFTVWLGGMGIIVLALAVLPRLRVGGRQFFELETAGPEIEPLTVSIREAARRFLVLYLAITALEVLTLSVVGWTGLDERMSPVRGGRPLVHDARHGWLLHAGALIRGVRSGQPVGRDRLPRPRGDELRADVQGSRAQEAGALSARRGVPALPGAAGAGLAPAPRRAPERGHRPG